MAARNFVPMFPIDLVEKDFRYVVSSAQAVTSSAPLAEAACRVFHQAVEMGFGGDNISAVACVYE